MVTERKRAKNFKEKNAEIMHYALQTPRIPRTELAEKLQTLIKWDGQVPEVEVLERKISWYRNHIEQSEEDENWSVETLNKFPIGADALPSVLEVWNFALLNKRQPLTMRQAKWVARLYKTLEGEDIKVVYLFAKAYAHREWLRHALAGKEDKFISTLGYAGDASLYSHYKKDTETFSILLDPELVGWLGLENLGTGAAEEKWEKLIGEDLGEGGIY